MNPASNNVLNHSILLFYFWIFTVKRTVVMNFHCAPRKVTLISLQPIVTRIYPSCLRVNGINWRKAKSPVAVSCVSHNEHFNDDGKLVSRWLRVAFTWSETGVLACCIGNLLFFPPDDRPLGLASKRLRVEITFCDFYRRVHTRR